MSMGSNLFGTSGSSPSQVLSNYKNKALGGILAGNTTEVGPGVSMADYSPSQFDSSPFQQIDAARQRADQAFYAGQAENQRMIERVSAANKAKAAAKTI